MALHWDWHIRLVDKDGNTEKECWRKNMVHNLGEQLLLQGTFAPLGTLLTVIEPDALYDQTGHADGSKCLHSASGTDDPFATVTAGDYLYLVGGTDNEVTAGVYVVASVGADDENVLLSADPYAGDVAGGIVVLLNRKLEIALDARTSPAEADVIGQMEAYEEDGTGYARQGVDPHSSSNWTIALDTTTDDYKATSAQVTFTATETTGTDWQTNYNASLVAHTGVIGSEANEVLVATCPFDEGYTLTESKSLYIDVYVRLGEES